MNSNLDYIIGAILGAVVYAAIWAVSFVGHWLNSL
jgi:hypothetical protein